MGRDSEPEMEGPEPGLAEALACLEGCFVALRGRGVHWSPADRALARAWLESGISVASIVAAVEARARAFAWVHGSAAASFALPGLGRLTVDAVLQRDYSIIQGVTLIFALVFAPIPGTSVRRPDSLSITRRVSSPNAATSLSAMTGPIPFISPDPRYRSMPRAVAGTTGS